MSVVMDNIANAFKDMIKQNGGILEIKAEDFDMALKSLKKDGGCSCNSNVGGKGKKTKNSKKTKKSKK